MKNIEKYLYHSIGLNMEKETLETLEKILKTGYIMTRDTLAKTISSSEWDFIQKEHRSNWNGTDSVSVACHPNNHELINKYDVTITNYKELNAYNNYTLLCITLILEPNILELFNQKKESKSMNYEIQLIGDIPITYIKAIGLNTNIGLCTMAFSPKNIYKLYKAIKEYEKTSSLKKYKKYYNEIIGIISYLETSSLEEIYDECIYINYVSQIIRLLKKYNLDIPIVDIKYGYELPSPDKQKKRIKKLRRQYKKTLQQ